MEVSEFAGGDKATYNRLNYCNQDQIEHANPKIIAHFAMLSRIQSENLLLCVRVSA